MTFYWKPMASIGLGVKEIRIHHNNVYRVIYGDAIYLLHAFVKKTQATPKKDIAIAKQRFSVIKR